MFEKVLFPVTTNEGTEQLLAHVHNFKRVKAKEIVMLHIVDSTDTYGDPLIVGSDRDILLKWKHMLLSYKFEHVRARVEVGIPWEEIVDIAEKENFSLIFMGSHGSRFLKRVFLGSVTENVLHHSRKPVLIYKFSNTAEAVDLSDQESLSKFNLFSRVLYATDFSEHSQKCIPFLEAMDPVLNKELIMLHIQDLQVLKYVSEVKMGQFNEIDQNRFDALKDRFEKKGFKNVKCLIKTGQSITEILDIMEKVQPSILIIGAKGKTNLKEMLLGGVAEIIVHRSRFPTFIIR